MKRIASLVLALCLILSFAACGQSAPAASPVPALPAAENSASAEPVPTAAASADFTSAAAADSSPAVSAVPGGALAGEEDMFTNRDRDASYEDFCSIWLADGASGSDGNVRIEGDRITITQEGTYRLSGSLSNGQILVDAPDSEKIQLVLAGADIACQGSAALYIRQADKVFLTLDGGTENSLHSGGEFIQSDENNVDAALFSKVDLSINGSGALTVTCDSAHGIVSKDDIKICSGSLTVTAAAKGIDGKDSIRIAGGDISVTAGSDGLQSEHETAEKGFIYVCGGSLTVTAGNDGLQASGSITIRDGSFTVQSGGGYENGAVHAQSFGGRGWQNASAETTVTAQTETVSDSFKGIKSDTAILISGGSFSLNCADDAIHSNTDLSITGGSFSIRTGDDALHADASLSLAGGTLDIPVCYEGIEATDILISGGFARIVSTDDGINAAGGTDGSGFGPMAQDRFSMASGSLNIAGGELYLNTEGDSLDANGTLLLSGGTVYISGPSGTGNGLLDFDFGSSVSGGLLVAAGVSGMQQNFGTGSTQGSILATLSSTQPAGTPVYLYDAGGQLLAQYSPEKNYSAVLISAPAIVSGGSYTLVAGSETQSITMTGLLYGSGGFGGMGGRGGGRR